MACIVTEASHGSLLTQDSQTNVARATDDYLGDRNPSEKCGKKAGF